MTVADEQDIFSDIPEDAGMTFFMFWVPYSSYKGRPISHERAMQLQHDLNQEIEAFYQAYL